jgi:hypothetical protein
MIGIYPAEVPAMLMIPTFYLLSLSLLSGQDMAFEKDVKPFLQQYCNRCHGTKSKKAGLDLERFASPELARKEMPLWEGVAARVRTHEMPPEGSRQPSIEARNAFLAWTTALSRRNNKNCNELATDQTQNFYKGHVMSRRLTRAEYDNSVRDLLGGVAMGLADRLPADGAGGEGFDTNGDALFTSAIHIEKYMQTAEEVLRAVLDTGAKSAIVLTAEQRAAARTRLGLERTPREIVATFATRAYRRPVLEAEVDRLMSVHDKALARGDSREQALKLPLKAVLISPNFLFLVEPEPEKEGVYPLPGYPLASRLSYFLWATMPDETLIDLAARGELVKDDVLRAQVKRMLKDPKAKGFAANFATQWLGLDVLGTTLRPDATKFPTFDDHLAADMKDETFRLIERVFREDRPLTELLTADYTYVNERLAKHYGIAGVEGEAFRLVSLPAERSGLLGQGAVLTATSFPLRTSPVLRGKWILEEILGSKVPPPPPNAGELAPDGKDPKGLTLRQQLELHRTRADCASCHNRMDPLGFGLEAFDAIGRYRTKDDEGNPIDARGKLPSGERFNGATELRDVLLKRKNEYLRNLSRKMLGYALGRQLYRFDQCVIDESMKALAARENRSHALIETIVMSYPFRHRFAKK